MNVGLSQFVREYITDPSIDVHDRIIKVIKGFEGVEDCKWQVAVDSLEDENKTIWLDQEIIDEEYEKIHDVIFGTVTQEKMDLEDKWKDEMVNKYKISRDSVLRLIEPYYIRLAITWRTRELLTQTDKVEFYGLLCLISEHFAQDYVPDISFSSKVVEGQLIVLVQLSISYGS